VPHPSSQYPQKPQLPRVQVFAILRCDRFQAGTAELQDAIRVVKVVHEERLARSEVDRLNGLNSGKDVVYLFQATRLEPPNALNSNVSP
jgi:hypothetical protein